MGINPRYIDKIMFKYETHFICPKCGSSYFGSYENPDNTSTRTCHGVNCNFEWHESDDRKYLFVSYLDIAHLLDIENWDTNT